MNVEAIQKTIDLMKNPPDNLKFKMHVPYYAHDDIIESCIAGFVLLANDPEFHTKMICADLRVAGNIIGIEYDNDDVFLTLNSIDLFCPRLNENFDYRSVSYDDVKVEHAIDVLERLIDTNRIDWNPVIDEILEDRT